MALYVCDHFRGADDADTAETWCVELANDAVPRHVDGCVRRDSYGGDWAVFDAASAAAAFAEWQLNAETQRWATVEQEMFEAAYRAGCMSLPGIDECWTHA